VKGSSSPLCQKDSSLECGVSQHKLQKACTFLSFVHEWCTTHIHHSSGEAESKDGTSTYTGQAEGELCSTSFGPTLKIKSHLSSSSIVIALFIKRNPVILTIENRLIASYFFRFFR